MIPSLQKTMIFVINTFAFLSLNHYNGGEEITLGGTTMTRNKNNFPNLEEQINNITLSTGNINKKYILRDIIFAADRVTADLFEPDADPNSIFSNVCLKLKQMAFEYNADAVINCHFEEKLVDKDGQKHIEIFAYGTVVQYTPTNIG